MTSNNASIQVNKTVPVSLNPKPSTPVTYAANGSSGGRVDANGNYTAGSRPGTDTVTASTNGNVIFTEIFTVTA